MTTQLISGNTPGANRNNLTGFAGVQFTPTAGYTYIVTQLGLQFTTGNSGGHTVTLVDSKSNTVASASVNLTGGSVGTYVYATLGSSVKLAGGLVYSLVATVTSGGQNFTDTGSVSMNDAGSITAVSGSALNSLSLGTANQMFSGVDLTFTRDGEILLSDLDGYAVITPGIQLSDLDGYAVITPGIQLSDLDAYAVLLAVPPTIRLTRERLPRPLPRKKRRPTTLMQVRRRYNQPSGGPHTIIFMA